MVKIKICGITNLADARAAIDAGADMLGFNFYRPSPRFIDPDRAREIIEQLRVNGAPEKFAAVGVFVNEPQESLLRTITVTRIDAVQLHGDESPEFCSGITSAIGAAQTIKVLRVQAGFKPELATRYPVGAIMLDAFHDRMRGGTGRTIDWELAAATRKLVPRLFLSGGLAPENVAAAIAQVRPFAVDACSSLESSAGVKEHSLIKAFVRAVRSG